MNTKNKNRENRRRELEKYSITKTLEGTQKRETSKSGKILTVDYVGMPCYGKIVKLVGFHPETPTIEKIVPIYQSCKNCGLYLGNLEEINSDVLDSMCIDCDPTFSIPKDSSIKKVYDDLEKTEILSKINKQREVEFEKWADYGFTWVFF